MGESRWACTLLHQFQEGGGTKLLLRGAELLSGLFRCLCLSREYASICNHYEWLHQSVNDVLDAWMPCWKQQTQQGVITEIAECLVGTEHEVEDDAKISYKGALTYRVLSEIVSHDPRKMVCPESKATKACKYFTFD